MSYRSYEDKKKFVPALIVGAVSVFALAHLPPVVSGQVIEILPAFFMILAVVCGSRIASECLWRIGGGLDWAKAHIPAGQKGTAKWAKTHWDIRKDINWWSSGPYWGSVPTWFGLRQKEIIADFASNAVTFGPAGSGKSTSIVIPTILSIHESKIICDFKAELVCQLKSTLEKRGKTVRVLNIGELFPEIVGPTDHYNVLDVIADDFSRSGGLQDVTSDIHELVMQLSPTKGDQGDGPNKFFREGERNLIAWAVLINILINGHQATLADVSQYLKDRQQMYQDALWACGKLPIIDPVTGEEGMSKMQLRDSEWAHEHDEADISRFCGYVEKTAQSIASQITDADAKSFGSFEIGAQQCLHPFNNTTRAAKIMGKSTFRFSETKEGRKPTSIFLVVDASRIEAQAPLVGLMQWAALTELKRHENKNRAVHVVCDEVSNFKLFGLEALLTFGRGYGIKLHLFLQSRSAFISQYGENAFKTLISETEIKIFLSGIREQSLIELLHSLLGEASIIAKSYNGNSKSRGLNIDGTSFSEAGKPLLTTDEIRRLDKAVLFIRKQRPMLVNTPSIAEIAPWRKQIAPNPFHGMKPYLKRIKLRIGKRKRPIFIRAYYALRTSILGE